MNELLEKIRNWGLSRKIIQNSNPMSQAIKTLEETTELLDAIQTNNMAEIEDAIGDVAITLVIVCGTLGIDFQKCVDGSYKVIEHRTGYLREDGVFIKDES